MNNFSQNFSHFISTEFLNNTHIKHAFFTKKIIGSNFKNSDIILNQCPFSFNSLSILTQKHTNHVVTINNDQQRNSPIIADAHVTNCSKIALGILTADCVPVLFADEKNNVIGAAHAGWKGALNGILENTIQSMIKLGSTKSQISAVIGPCIRQANYEVGPEFFEKFIEISKDNFVFFKESNYSLGRKLFDLPGYVAFSLKKEGIINVNDTNLNTFTDEENFFSYRNSTLKGKMHSGNQISIVVLN